MRIRDMIANTHPKILAVFFPDTFGLDPALVREEIRMIQEETGKRLTLSNNVRDELRALSNSQITIKVVSPKK